MGVWTSSARALGYVPAKVSFTGLGDAQSVAVDSANNVYAGDVSTPQVLESRPLTLQQFLQQTLSFSACSSPEAIAVDRAAMCSPPTGSTSAWWRCRRTMPPGENQRTLPFTGLGEPFGVAVDAAGDTFVSDLTMAGCSELSPGGVQQTVPFTGLEQDRLTVNSRICSSPTRGTIGCWSCQPTDAAEPAVQRTARADRRGGRFGGRHVRCRPSEQPRAGARSRRLPQALPINGLDKPTGVAVDSAGDVFVANGAGGVIELLQYVGSGSLAVAPGTGPAVSDRGGRGHDVSARRCVQLDR